MDILSREERLDTMFKDIEDLVARGVSDDIEEGGAFYALRAIPAKLPHLPAGSLEHIQRQLNALKDAARHRKGQDERWEAEAAPRVIQPLTEDDVDYAEMKRLRDEAAAVAARAAGPMTAGQADELISLQRNILAALMRT